MLPNSPFFSTSIMPIISANIATITSLELENCDLKASDVDKLSTFVKKNKSIEVLNLSQNELFGSNDESNSAAKQLSKAMKNHPELSFVSLASTGLGGNNDGLKLILDGSKSINILIIDDNNFDEEGLTLVTKFLRNKNSTVELGMDSIGIGEGDSSKAKSKLLKECLVKNTTLEQLSLGSNMLGSAKGRVLSTILSGIKASTSLAFVDLSGNNIRTMPSIKLVAKYLASNPALIGLDLSNNGIPAKSASVLIATLKKNTNLKQLYLMNNNITDQSIPAFTDALQNNNTLQTLDLMGTNFSSRRIYTTKNNFVGRKEILKALCDTTSLDSIANNSNHTCNLILAGCNYAGSHEEEFSKINALENEGEKIRYKVVLALCVLNKDLYNPRMFDDVPLELMPKLLEIVQQEMGCNGFGEGIVKSVKKRNTINRLSNIYEAIHQWPAFPSLFDRGPGKGSLTKTGKLKRKREMGNKKVAKVVDEDEDFVPNGFRKTKKRYWWMPSPEPVKPSRSSSRVTNIASISYADAENSEGEDES